MSLPEIALDDRHFQDLVNEARGRIAQSCPEWTDHNVSDPGITLIELFAWFTEQTIYRLNRIPEKLHVALLELMGIRLQAPTPARAAVRFALAEPAVEPVHLPLATEIGTRHGGGEAPVVFQTDAELTILPLRPVAYVLQRGAPTTDVGVVDGVARPSGPDQAAFSSPPRPGDALHLGFEHPLSRLVMRVDVEGSRARGAGVVPEDPPLRWEVSGGDGTWHAAEVLVDGTGGFNHGSGAVELQLPEQSAPDTVRDHRLHWLRCRVDALAASGRESGSYAQPPEIGSITAAPIGAQLPASHARLVEWESLGISDGTPTQRFPLQEAPVLPLAGGETLEVLEPGHETWTPWTACESFAASGPEDAHFRVDHVAGEVELGPAVRERDGRWRQCGAVPAKGAVLRFTRYRNGGGSAGNVAARQLCVLKASIPGVDSVVNPRPASGGVDAEPLSSARERAALELRSRDRAVTAADVEHLAVQASRRIARARCESADGGSAVVRLVARVEGADRRLERAELVPDDELFATVAAHLDARRMLGTEIRLLPARLRGVSVAVDVRTSASADPHRVQHDVEHALYTFLNPVVGGDPTGPGAGWPFGRPLNLGELYGVVHAISGVAFVRMLRIYECDPETGRQRPEPAGTHLVIEPDELLVSGTHVVRAMREEEPR